MNNISGEKIELKKQTKNKTKKKKRERHKRIHQDENKRMGQVPSCQKTSYFFGVVVN